MPFYQRSSKKQKQKFEETHLKQNYVDEEDLIPFLKDRFQDSYKIRTLDDGSKMVEAPRKLSEPEIQWLRKLKEDREPRQSVFNYGYNYNTEPQPQKEYIEDVWPEGSKS